MKIVIKNLQKKIPIYPKRIKKAILKTLSLEGAKLAGEITICFVNNKEIKELNLMYLGKDDYTDVIAFDNSPVNKELLWGDIAISVDMAVHNAKIFKTSYLYEICLYVIHGVLHLLGYSDQNQRERRIMHDKANHILNKLKIN